MDHTNRKKTSYYIIPQSDEVDSDLVDTDTVDGVTNYNYERFGKVYMFGEKASGFEIPGPLQDYAKLRQHHLQNRTLFRDEIFSPENIVLTKLSEKVVWKRPFEIIKNPEFIVDGASRFDVKQGEIGDCWFVAALADVTLNPKLFSKVVPQDQGFHQGYAGIFHFRFWQYGRWIDIVVDDRLPTINNDLIYLHSEEPSEFWPSLLEKAYAKLNGSYKNIEFGQISEALEDLYGGLSEFYGADNPHIYEIMQISYERGSFMGCFIRSPELEGRRDDGLVTKHAYSVTAVKKIRIGEADIKLIRLRNPWGDDSEWNGDWSDSSDTWMQLPKQLRDELQSKKPDGEFWMEVKDFRRSFSFVDICHLNPSSFLFDRDDNKHWNVNMFEEKFVSNHKYHFTIRGHNEKETYDMVIGLMQEYRRSRGEDEFPIKLSIYKIKSRNSQNPDSLLCTDSTKGRRQLTIRVSLPVGRYYITPSSVEPNGNYLLRIYSEIRANIKDVI